MNRASHRPHALGRLGERLAAAFLADQGWSVLSRNYRFGRREVDIVARRRDLIAFVEVKTRSGVGYGAPAEAVTRLKRREIEAVAAEYLIRRSLDDVGVRFDVISIVVERGRGAVRIDHLEDAWRPEPAR